MDEQAAPETKGVTVELLALVDLASEIEGLAGRQLRMRLVTIEPGGVIGPIHDHKGRPGTVYVLQGTLRYSVGSDTRDLVPGQSMQTPRGTVHGFSNPFDSVARALIVMSPDVGAQYFRDVAEVVNVAGPPDKAALVAVMTRYGLVPAAPR